MRAKPSAIKCLGKLFRIVDNTAALLLNPAVKCFMEAIRALWQRWLFQRSTALKIWKYSLSISAILLDINTLAGGPTVSSAVGDEMRMRRTG